jgi:medium-chain acyl-[acyl-carrier-protein] hydrolase
LTAWLVRHARPAARLRLFCFPYAGIGASAFRLWPAALPVAVEVVSIQLPGRETRLREPALSGFPDMVGRLLPELRDHLDLPYAFFGHSMGATLAWATARALAAEGLPPPLHVILSGRRAPRIPDPDLPLRDLSDAQFIDEIDRRFGGIPAQVRASGELMALLLPALRADIAALETYRQGEAAPLPFPLTVFGGLQDARAPVAQLDAWREETCAAFRVQLFPGGHFFINTGRDAVLAEVARILHPLLESQPAAVAGHAP